MVRVYKPVKKNFGRWWRYKPELKDKHKARGVVIAAGKDKWNNPVLVFLDVGKMKANGWSAYTRETGDDFELVKEINSIDEYEPNSVDKRKALRVIFEHSDELLKLLGKLPR